MSCVIDETVRSMCLPDWLHRQAVARANHPAIVYEGKELSYSQLLQRAMHLAGWLSMQGVRKGDRVAVLMKSGYAYALTVHALMQCGAVLLSLNLRLTDAELAWQLQDAEVALLVHDDLAADLAEAAWQASQLPGDPRVIPLDVEVATTCEEAALQLSLPHAMMYTSGTTGFPKGVVLTYQNHWWGAIASAMRLGLDANDRWLAAMPLFHVGGLNILMRSLIYGTTVVIHDRFDPVAVNDALDGDGITLISAVPTMLRRLVDARAGRPYSERLRSLLLGGSGAAPSLIEEALALRLPIQQSYGLTEANSQVTTLPAADSIRKLGSSGLPLLPTQVAIWADGQPVTKAGLEGEIVIKGPTVTPGYWHRPEENARVFTDGWFHTGDVGYFDAEGYLYVLDRRNDLIVSGGENIYPAEVEAVLSAHPAVLEAGVVGQQDDQWGHVPIAYVVPRNAEAAPTAAALMAFCEERLAKYKVPTAVHFVQQLPRNAAGKLMRKNLR